MNCRHCNTPLQHVFLDLGFAPPSNAYVSKEALQKAEIYLPLKLFVCDRCWLVQTEDFTQADELFRYDYAYYSSTSSSWLEHARRYTTEITERLQLGPQSFVIEVASNDGYLLRNFLSPGIPCLGIEPTQGTAKAAESLGIPVLKEFFTNDLASTLASEGRQADLIIGNNVYAHVPDINDFTTGLKTVLKPQGVITLEFPHLMQLIENNQFDTVYHEHFSYLSLLSVCQIFSKAGLRVWDVQELPTHGGSLRVYGCHEDAGHSITDAVGSLLEREVQRGMQNLSIYKNFQSKADNVKNEFLNFLLAQKRVGKKIAAYGAAAKGNTLLNYAGIKPDLLPFVCDAAPAKQGKFMPGSHIPIFSPTVLDQQPPDYLIVLPWNIIEEVKRENRNLALQGTKFVTAVPKLSIA